MYAYQLRGVCVSFRGCTAISVLKILEPSPKGGVEAGRAQSCTDASPPNYCLLQKIGNSLKTERRALPTPSKRYTPYNFTNIALHFINRALFYSSLLKL